MRDLYPGQNKEPGVTGDDCARWPPATSRGEAGHHPAVGIGQMLQVLANRMGVALLI